MSTSRTITIEHEGVTYYGHVAKIDSTMIGVEDHGIVTAYLHCSWDSGGIGVGGYCLDTSVKDADGKRHREGTAYGLDHIMTLAKTVGVDTWEKLKGASVIVLFTSEHSWGTVSVGIAGLHNNRVMILKDHADAWKAAHPEPVSA